MPCPNCGTECTDTMKFCGECGTVLRAPDLEASAERRHITILFADMVGSTALSESLDPELLRDLYGDYQAVCAKAIERYDGHIAQYLGDGVMAYFGYPRAHEDDALRAVRSALELMANLKSIRVQGHRPKVRIGIHTGLVVIGDVGGKERLATGETPNVAARIQTLAEPDTVLIGDATEPLVAGHFHIEAKGPHELKGLSRPMDVFQIQGLSDASSRFQAKASRGLTPFIGRTGEVEAVEQAWAQSRAGAGQTLLFRGEAGIGKSRMLGVVSEIAGSDSPETFEIECSPYHMNEPLYPVTRMILRRAGLAKDAPGVDALEQFSRSRGADPDETVPYLAHLLSIPGGERYPVPPLPPMRLRQQSMQILTRLLLRSPDDRPVLLLVEDLHWADPSTLDLVQALVRAQVEAPHLMVCTTRPEGVTLESPAGNCLEIQILPLPQGASAHLVSSVVGSKPLPQSVAGEIIMRTGGVPLFIEAVTRTILEAGVLTEEEDRYELSGPLPAGLIPATVHDSLMARIDMLGPAKTMAQLASTIGREFSFELLAAVSGRGAGSLETALERLVDFDIVSQRGQPPTSSYLFKHALIQDAAYTSLLRRKRQKYHGQIAEALVKHFPLKAERQPELLARHFEGAGNLSKAIGQWMKAGGLAGERSAMPESVAHLRKAVSLLETLPADHEERLSGEMAAQLALGPALTATVGWGSPDVEEACTRARDLCLQLENMQGLLAAQWVLWTVYLLRGETLRGLEAAQPVLDMAMATENPILHIAAHHAAGFSLYFHADFEEALEHGIKARAHWDLERERELIGMFQMSSSVACAVYHFQSLWFLGYPEQAEARYREAWGMVESLDMLLSTVYGLGVCVWLPYSKRDVETIAPWAERLFKLCDEEGFLLWRAQARMYRGWAQSMQGDAERGIEELRQGWEEYTAIGSAVMAPQIRLMMAEALRAGGRLDAALTEIAKGIQAVAQKQEHAWEPELYRLQGEIQIQNGAVYRGEASLRQAVGIAREQKARMLELLAATSLARALRDQDRAAEGAALLQPVYDWFQEGFDTRELRAARDVLDDIGAVS